MKKFLQTVVIFFGCLNLVSCSLFSPVKTPVITEYRIDSAAHPVHTVKKEKITLLVLTPEAKGDYNSTKMMYTMHPHQSAAYSVNAWAQSPAQMIQPLIVQTLDRTGYFHAIVTPPFLGNYDYFLSTQIIEFLQDYTSARGIFCLNIRAQVVSMKTGKVVSTKNFSMREPIFSATPDEGVRAANRAVQKMLGQLAAFVVKSI